MSEAKEFRYAKRQGIYEKELNIHIREMIEMIKREQVKENLYVKAVKLSSHGLKRMREYFGVKSLATATKIAKDMLKDARRLGTVLSADGRINVLYAYCQTGFFLSPDLKTIVTVNRFSDISYRPLMKKSRKKSREELLELHFNILHDIEREEENQIQLILTIEESVREAVSQCSTMLSLIKGSGRKSDIKQLISEQNAHLKKAGRKLFDLKVDKRRLCKSLVSLC